MFNYYQYAKIKQKEKENEISLMKEANYVLDKKLKENIMLINHDLKVKNFMVDMLENPIIIDSFNNTKSGKSKSMNLNVNDNTLKILTGKSDLINKKNETINSNQIPNDTVLKQKKFIGEYDEYYSDKIKEKRNKYITSKESRYIFNLKNKQKLTMDSKNEYYSENGFNINNLQKWINSKNDKMHNFNSSLYKVNDDDKRNNTDKVKYDKVKDNLDLTSLVKTKKILNVYRTGNDFFKALKDKLKNKSIDRSQVIDKKYISIAENSEINVKKNKRINLKDKENKNKEVEKEQEKKSKEKEKNEINTIKHSYFKEIQKLSVSLPKTNYSTLNSKENKFNFSLDEEKYNYNDIEKIPSLKDKNKFKNMTLYSNIKLNKKDNNINDDQSKNKITNSYFQKYYKDFKLSETTNIKKKVKKLNNNISKENLNNLFINLRNEFNEVDDINPIITDLIDKEEDIKLNKNYATSVDMEKCSESNLKKVMELYLKKEQKKNRSYYEILFKKKMKKINNESFLKSDPITYFKSIIGDKDMGNVKQVITIDNKKYALNDLNLISKKILSRCNYTKEI